MQSKRKGPYGLKEYWRFTWVRQYGEYISSASHKSGMSLVFSLSFYSLWLFHFKWKFLQSKMISVRWFSFALNLPLYLSLDVSEKVNFYWYLSISAAFFTQCIILQVDLSEDVSCWVSLSLSVLENLFLP